MANSKFRCTFCKKYKPNECKIDVIAGNFCCRDHLIEYGLQRTDALLKTARKETKKKHAQEKRDFKANDRKIRLPAAQKAFNTYIRKRDERLPCVSCYRPIHEIEQNDSWKPGGCWDCGHYITVGAAPELRFEPKNAHRQCKSCNGGSGKYTRKNSSVAKEYRIKLIERIGLIDVEWLEGPHDAKKYTVEQLKEIELFYKEKLKKLTDH